MVGIRPVTPGTVVVFAGTLASPSTHRQGGISADSNFPVQLLTLVSVSTPLLKSIYFLSASVAGSNEVVTFGVWGYCIGATCSKTTLGYSLDNVDTLLGVSGALAKSGAAGAVVQWLTYALVLHPIAAAFGLVATFCGFLAHFSEVAGTSFTTCFASFGAGIALLALIFDFVAFSITKSRIEALGGTASLANAVWMTLVGMLCLMFSGCFFGVGRCLIRKRRTQREASEGTKPMPNSQYGQAARQEALHPGSTLGYGQSAMYGHGPQPGAHNTGSSGGLPAFGELNGEIIPLNTLAMRSDEDFDEYEDEEEKRRSLVREGSRVTGVGVGYGRRADVGPPVAPSNASGDRRASYGAPASSRSRSEYTASVAPFVGMSAAGPPPLSPSHSVGPPLPLPAVPQATLGIQPTGYYPSIDPYAQHAYSTSSYAPPIAHSQYPTEAQAYAYPTQPEQQHYAPQPEQHYAPQPEQHYAPPPQAPYYPDGYSQSHYSQPQPQSPTLTNLPPYAVTYAPTYETHAQPYEHSTSTFGGGGPGDDRRSPISLVDEGQRHPPDEVAYHSPPAPPGNYWSEPSAAPHVQYGPRSPY